MLDELATGRCCVVYASWYTAAQHSSAPAMTSRGTVGPHDTVTVHDLNTAPMKAVDGSSPSHLKGKLLTSSLCQWLSGLLMITQLVYAIDPTLISVSCIYD